MEEYNQKRYEVAKDILASILTPNEVQNGDSKLRESLVFNSVRIAESLLDELYLVSGRTADGDEPSVHSLSSLLKSNKTKV